MLLPKANDANQALEAGHVVRERRGGVAQLVRAWDS